MWEKLQFQGESPDWTHFCVFYAQYIRFESSGLYILKVITIFKIIFVLCYYSFTDKCLKYSNQTCKDCIEQDGVSAVFICSVT